jgi:hypothetical protein
MMASSCGTLDASQSRIVSMNGGGYSLLQATECTIPKETTKRNASIKTKAFPRRAMLPNINQKVYCTPWNL